MIRPTDITRIGTFLKPHGIKGEIAVQSDYEIDLSTLRCIIIEIDGIPVPFFINSIRNKSASTVLIGIDGFTSEQDVKELCGQPLFALTDEVRPMLEESQSDGFYVDDIIGFTITDEQGNALGTIADYDDSTENVILLVDANTSGRIFIPLADEYVIDFDNESQTIRMALPEGLTDINKA